MNRIVAVPVLAGVLLLLGGCADSVAPEAEADDLAWVNLGRACSPKAPTYGLPQVKRDSIGPYIGPLYPDAQWAEIARQVPGGFAGVYYAPGTGRPPGPLTVVLVDPSQKAPALEALGRLLDRSLDLSGAEIRKGRWNFAQLFDWQRYLHQHAFLESGLTMADIDEVANRLEYGVEDEAARERLTRRFQQLDLPCFLVAIEIVPPAELR